MANSYKDIVITPNRGSSSDDPKIVFSGANTTVNTDITLRAYPESNGTLSFEGSAGQLFSITNDLTGSIFSVNDVSGIPLIDVNVTSQLVTLVPFYGNVSIGSGIITTSGSSFISQKTAKDVPIQEYNTQAQYNTYKAFIRSTNANNTFTLGRLADATMGFYGYFNSTTANQTDFYAVLDNFGIWTVSSEVRGTLFRDTNNTAYYVDPLGTSVMNTISMQGNIQPSTVNNTGGGTWYFGTSAWGGNAGGGVNSVTGILYSGGTGSQLFTIASGSGQISLQVDGSLFAGGAPLGYNPHSINSASDGFVACSGGMSSGGIIYSNASVRAPIFYDSDDTNVRWDNNVFVLRGASPSIFLRDTDGTTAALHCNSNYFYILRGTGDTESMTQVNSQWPLYINLTNNDAVFGGNLTAAGSLYATRYYDSDNTAYYLDPAATSTLNRISLWSGTTSAIHVNEVSGAASYNFIMSAGNDTGTKLVAFVNGSTRNSDGGNNAVVIRNDGGPFVLGSTSYVTTVAGSYVGIPNDLIISGGADAIQLNNGTSNYITWNTAGVAAPTFTTRSAGTKLVLYPSITASGADYALGIENGTMWYSVQTTSNQFKWYGGTTLAMTLSGAGALSAASLSLTTALPVASGGTGVTTSTGSGSVVLSNSPTLVTPALGTPASGNLANCTFPTLNQNTTGSAGSVTNALTINNGGAGSASGTTYNGSAAVTISHNSIGAVALAGSTMTGLLIGRADASANVSVSNDGGSFSVRGSSTTPATMSFHRPAAYAVNMGLDTDNVFKIGGWSDGVNTYRLQLATSSGTSTINSSLNVVNRLGVNNASPGSRFVVTNATAGLTCVATQGVAGNLTLDFNGGGGHFYDAGGHYFRNFAGTTLATIGTALTGTGNRLVYSDANGQLTNTASDLTLKTNIEPITYGLNAILQLNPISFNWKDHVRFGKQREIGFGAQEVKQVIPEVIGINSDDTLSLDYPKLTAALTKAIQELSGKLDSLKAEFDAYKSTHP